MRQLFQQVFGASLYNYFQAARMEEAKRQLAYLSVSEVGYKLGFTNLSHFARLFAKHHGLTPKKYQAMRSC
ncbi:helix-turn-helix domain-containing protein [Hymenobacter volaticus]|uniref:Helix-turn-helix domain-containing protein n=1 Tax=Hymenobacter volaticus TaxID=2932254 RepID=A0ABY4GDD0_9BACT|nr:helix-turn-helix domain-containing protein [Hymenobacter volaticus]UOQ68867.1 helix-turn-helix domain-containing protein [Hymenobacter volaticus]